MLDESEFCVSVGVSILISPEADTCRTIDGVEVVGGDGVVKGCDVVTGGGCKVETDEK